MSQKKQTGPLQNLYRDIKKIIDFMEVKNVPLAKENETTETISSAELWLAAKLQRDSFVTYKNWWTKAMFNEINSAITTTDYNFYIANPYSVPIIYRESLLEKGRQLFLDSYEEKNNYYRMLMGLPDVDDTDYIYLSSELQSKYNVRNVPVHELSTYVQNKYINTEEYEEVVENNPDKKYLKYLGLYKIDLYTARTAKDFDIIRYPINRSDINPYLLDTFSSVYADGREYIMVTLYNEQLEDLYVGYRDYMGFLILTYAMMHTNTKAIEAVSSHKYLDDTMIYIMLSMYGIPDSLLLTNEVRRNLAIKIMKLVKEKATNEVYYDIIKILGYHDVAISKLMLMKGQSFNSDGKVETKPNFYIEGDNLFIEYNDSKGTLNISIDDNGNLIWINNDQLIDDEMQNVSFNIEDYDLYFNHDFDDYKSYIPYFLQLDLKSKNFYDDIANGKAKKYSYEEIISGDPSWWDGKEVRDILQNKQYSEADSKYIMIEATIHQMKSMFESIYFTRLILDNKTTDEFMISIPELFGTTQVSIYDCIVFIICATCMNNGLSGEIVTESDKLLATAGFNFDIDFDSFMEYIDESEYLEKDRIKSFLSDLTIGTETDVVRLFNDVLYPLREWLESKIVYADTRKEYLEYEAVYRALFTYDISRNHFLDDFQVPIKVIQLNYDLTDEEIKALKAFYPHSLDNKAITVEDFNSSVNNTRYRYPFLSISNPVDWYIHIIINTPHGQEDRGYLYLYDILNSDDLRTVKNSDDEYIFMDYESDEGWTVNQTVVERALYLIDHLEDDDLKSAYFQVSTPKGDGTYYDINEKLPANVRTSIYKSILKDKITMDMDGLSEPPTSYFEYLYRKNRTLYDILMDPIEDRFNKNKESWMNDVMSVILAMENGLSIHTKYLEQSVLGKELFFQPLITLIKHFKSLLVDIARTNIRYVFDDKMDIGGNSNMLKMFDELTAAIHFATITGTGFTSEIGLYDSIGNTKFKIMMKDRTELIKMVIGEGFLAEHRTSKMGSIRMVDEMKCYKNGKPIESDEDSMWYTDEPDNGRWSQEDDVLMKTRTKNSRVQSPAYDMEGWKEFVDPS